MPEITRIAEYPARQGLKAIAESLRDRDGFDGLADAIQSALVATGHQYEASMIHRYLDAYTEDITAPLRGDVDHQRDAADEAEWRADQAEQAAKDAEDENDELRSTIADLQQQLDEARQAAE